MQHAEAAVGFFDLWGLAVVFPLYTLHLLVLAYLIFRRRQVTLPTLFLAGALVGMYEAYMTKVLWNPFWAPELIVPVGGIAIIHTAILVLFWHPWMAFILPLLLGESFFASSSETLAALPAWVQKPLQNPRGRLLIGIGLALFCGIYPTTAGPDRQTALLSGLEALAVLTALALLWRWVSRGARYTLRELLPSRNEAIVLGILLLGLYLALGITQRLEALPRTLGPHLTVWALYALLGGLLFASWRRAPAPVPTAPSPLRNPGLVALGVSLIFPITAALMVGIDIVALIVVTSSWVLGSLLGLILLVYSAWKLARPPEPEVVLK